MTTAIERQENGTIQLTITIPAKKIEEIREKLITAYLETAELPGFRKGKAPRKLVEEKINQEKLHEDILREILPNAYAQAVTETKIRPILNPKLHIDKIEDGKDWQFTALTCELPKIDLGNYKEEVKKITAKSKIVIPGKDIKEPSMEEIVQALLESVKITIPQILLDQEVDRLLSQTLDEIKHLGLTLDQYLASTGKNTEALREEYAKKAGADITLEFALQKIAETEKLTVEEVEIDEAVAKAKDEAERKHLEQNRYLLANILRQQKSLDFLKNL